MTKKATIILFAALGLLGAAAAVSLATRNRDPLHAKARVEWARAALEGLRGRASDTNWVQTEAAMLKRRTAEDPSGGWFSDHMIRMANGEWIVYDAKCQKRDKRIYDIFVGRGSDGKWYYSTVHFCVQMMVLRMEEPSQNLAGFVTNYSLREFDGRCDACLQKTWPPPRK